MNDNDPASNSNDELYETHPLDRDYSAPVQAKAKLRTATTIPFYPLLRRIGIIVFAVGFFTVLIAAVTLSNTQGGLLESIGSSFHFIGMVLILVGGVLFIAAYRLPHLTGTFHMPNKKRGWRLRGSYLSLVLWNGAALIAIPIAAYLGQHLLPQAIFGLIGQAVLTFTLALAIVVIVWRRDFIRAYAIGAFVASVVTSFSSVMFMSVGFRRAPDGFGLLLIGNFATILVCGLLCAGYVRMIERRAETPDESTVT